MRVGSTTVAWLPPTAAVSEDTLAQHLDPAEAAYADTLRHDTRRAEFRRSRYLIRALTGFFGPLPKNPEGDPTWPPETLGSLTHKDGYIGVALAPADACRGLGLDAELVSKMKAGFEPRIASDAESRLLDAEAARQKVPRTQLLALVFSFKEALFKAHFPLGRRMFYFLDAEVTALTETAIAAKVLVPTSPYSPAGSVTGGQYVWKETASGLMVVSVAVVS